jgi:hypothetical protein
VNEDVVVPSFLLIPKLAGVLLDGHGTVQWPVKLEEPQLRKGSGYHTSGDYPKDPADRIIGATALVEGLFLLTADRGIRRSKAVRTIW